ISPIIPFRREDFPEPTLPTIINNSPCLHSKLISVSFPISSFTSFLDTSFNSTSVFLRLGHLGFFSFGFGFSFHSKLQFSNLRAYFVPSFEPISYCDESQL